MRDATRSAQNADSYLPMVRPWLSGSLPWPLYLKYLSWKVMSVEDMPNWIRLRHSHVVWHALDGREEVK